MGDNDAGWLSSTDRDDVWKMLADAGIADISTYTEDEPYGMTNGRAIAKFLSRFRWYNPSAATAAAVGERVSSTEAGNDDAKAALPKESDGLLASYPSSSTVRPESKVPPPNLDAAWYYFEHMVLPRRFCKEDGGRIKSAVDSIKAMPGEVGRPTRLYNPFRTTLHELADFGIGIGLYFSMLRGVAIVMFVAALIHIPNFIFFSSHDYSANGQSAVKFLLKGSAICTDQKWVPCPSCRRDYSDPILEELWYTSRVTYSDDGLLFALKNTCGGENEEYLYSRGIVSLVGTIFIVIALLSMGEVQRKLSVEFDERNATATDFSICIKNPPTDATDAEEWKTYLEKVVATYLSKEGKDITQRDTHVTCLTVALDNYQLTDALIVRRRLKRSLLDLLGIDEDTFDNTYSLRAKTNEPYTDAAIKSDCNIGLGGRKAKALFGKMKKLDKTIRNLELKTYNVKRIFASFETEVGQRAALTALSASKLAIWKNNTNALDEQSYLFRGKVLDTSEPTEPLTVRWRDLGVPERARSVKRIATFSITILAIISAFLLVRYVWRHHGAGPSSLFIAILNILTPPVCRGITSLEVHSTEGRKQASHGLRVLGLRCVNSAIIIHLVTPFSWSITNGEHLIKGVCAIFVAELMTAPLVQILNIPGMIKMHIIAPRCKDQDSMNEMFQGGKWELGERYTNMMKILFLCFFFSALFPGAFALSALSLFVHYEADKFCLMRIWAFTPSLDGQVAEMNRSYIVPLFLATLAIMNGYLWSGFPYDSLCASSDGIADAYIGKHTITLLDGKTSIDIKAHDSVYRSCNQDFLDFDPIQFPPLPVFQEESWMSEGQAKIARLHGWTGVAVLGVAVLYILFISDLSEKICSLFKGTYKPSGEIYGVDFSDVPGEIFEAYVPQISARGFSFPLILCDISSIDTKFIGWKDEDGDPSEHVLFTDLPPEVTANKDKPIFSIVKHWPPPHA